MRRMSRPAGYPTLRDYKPTRFMLPTSHYDEAKADRAVMFIECMRHTKGKWAGQPFYLLPWQEQLIRDVFGVVKADGTRQFKTVWVEIMKKAGKSELAAAVALYLLYGDGEHSPEVYGAAADRQQASIVYNVAKGMVEQSDSLMKRSKILDATKRLINYQNNGVYQVLSAEVKTKHGFSVSGLVMDEVHAQPNRDLYDVLTKGSGLARQQPLYFLITTAGNDVRSIAYELHQKALDIMDGRKVDPTFYPMVWGVPMDADWQDENEWIKANPSLGTTITLEGLREEYQKAKGNPAEENGFRQLMLNQWVKQTIRWMPMDKWNECAFPVDPDALRGRPCYGGLDLSTTTDVTAFVLVFPPDDENGKFEILPFFWVPEETLDVRVRQSGVPYDVWKGRGYLKTTEGNVLHYGFIREEIRQLGEIYNIREIAYDRWGATEMIQNLQDDGFAVVPFGQGFTSMSPPTKDLMNKVLEHRIAHGGNPVLGWMMDNVAISMNPTGDIKMNKAKSSEKIDGAVALVMAMDRAVRHTEDAPSVYDSRGLLFI